SGSANAVDVGAARRRSGGSSRSGRLEADAARAGAAATECGTGRAVSALRRRPGAGSAAAADQSIAQLEGGGLVLVDARGAPETGRCLRKPLTRSSGKYPRQDSNLQPSAPEADALSN